MKPLRLLQIPIASVLPAWLPAWPGLPAWLLVWLPGLPAQDLVIQEGHRGQILCAAFRADGKTVVTGGYDGTIKVWDSDRGRLIRSFSCYGRPNEMELTADGRTLVAGGINSSAVLLDLYRGKVLFSKRLFDQGGYCGGAISAGGKLFAGGGDRNIGIYRVAGPKLLHHFEAPQKDRFYDVAFNLEASHLAVASDERTVYIVSVESGKEVRRLAGHSGQVRRVLLHDDDKHLLSLVRKGEVTVWNWRTGEVVRKLGGEGFEAISMSLSRDGTRVAIGDAKGSVSIYQLGSGKLEKSFSAHRGWVWTVAFHPAGDRLLTGGETGVHVWEWARPMKVQSLGRQAMDRPLAVAVTADGKVPIAVWTPASNGLRVFELRSKKNLWTAPANAKSTSAPRVSFSPGGTHIAFARRGEPVDVWDLTTGRKSPSYRAGQIQTRGAFALGPSGKTLACRVNEEEIAVWQHDRAQRLRTLPGKKSNDILSMTFSPDGKALAQGGKGNYLRVLDAVSGKHSALNDRGAGWIFGLALRSDGRQLLCGGPYSALTLRTLPDLKAVHTMLGHRGSILSVAFSNDHRHLFSVGSEGTVRVWQAKTGNHLLTVRMLADRQWLLTTPDDRWQASARAGEWCSWMVADKDRGMQLRPLASQRQELRSQKLVEETLAGH